MARPQGLLRWMEAAMRRADHIAEMEADRRRFLNALYDIRAELVGHEIKPGHIQKIIELIDKAVMCGGGR